MSVSKKRERLLSLAVLALLLAVEVVLSRFLSVSLWNVKFGFAFIPVVLAAHLYGTLGCIAVGALGDLVGALLFPIGPYFPGFTLTAALCGAVYGLCLRDRITVWRTLAAVGFSQIVGTLLLNTLWISVLYDSPFWPLLLTRLLEAALMGAVMCGVVLWLVPRLARPLRPLLFTQ